jgi:hypothetical protein
MPPADRAAVPAKRRGPSRKRQFADSLGSAIGYGIGALVVFPVLVGVMCAGIAYIAIENTDTYEQAFIIGTGVTFLVMACFVTLKVLGAIMINLNKYWPITLAVVGIVVAWKVLT